MKNSFNYYINKFESMVKILYIIGIIIFAFSRVYQYSVLIEFSSSVKSILRIAAFGLLFPKVVLSKYSKKEIAIISLLYLTTVICIIFGGDYNMIIIPTALVGIKDCDIKKLIKHIFIITIFALLIHLIAFMIKCINEKGSLISIFYQPGRYNKNHVMYIDNNMYAIRFTFALMQYMYITNRKNRRYLKAIIMAVLSVFILLLTKSRTSFILDVLLVIYMLMENSKILNKYIKVIEFISLPFGLISSICLCYFPYIDSWFTYKVIDAISGRPYIFAIASNYIGLNMLPSVEKFDSMSKVFDKYMLPDNSYVSIILKWGLIVSLLICVLIYILVYRQKKENIISYFVFIMSLWFIIEYISMEVVLYIVPLVLMNNYFDSNKVSQINKDEC